MTHIRSFSGLNWVSGELYEVVRKARDALEEYVEAGGETSVLGPCVSDLNQIRGVLEMLQLYGAARLAEEMRVLAAELRDEFVERPQEAAEALMLAMIQLPDYLEKLESGGEDIPLLLLPAINDLRLSRGADVLNEADLLISGLVHGSGHVNFREGADEVKRVVHDLRPRFHKALVAWFRDSQSNEGPIQLGEIFSELEQHCPQPLLIGVFRTAHAVIEGLLDGSIASEKDIKGLVGRLDKVIKIIAEHGSDEASKSVDPSVVKELLVHVAKVESDNPRIVSLKADYELDKAFPSEEELAEARKRMRAPNADVLASIRSAAVKELLPIKDTLDLYMRGGRDHADQLLELEQPLRRLANTLEMAELDALGQRLRSRAGDLKSIGQGDAPEEDALMMRIAGDLLFVESSLDNLMLTIPTTESETDDVGEHVPQGEIRNLINKTLVEAAVDMAKAKEAIGVYIESPSDTKTLENIPPLFHGVSGALRVISHFDAATILDEINTYIQSTLAAGKVAPDARALEALADGITGIEYYMEAVIENRGDTGQILNLSQSALKRLTEQRPLTEDEPLEATLPDAPGETLPTEVLPEYEVEESELSDLLPPFQDSGIDPEILEIFLEEAREEAPIIDEAYGRWRDDPEDHEALSTFRRSFHTLKGSGRLAGAMAIGDYAWAVENLLNRIIDQTLSVNDDIQLFLDRAVGILPELISAQEENRPPESDVEGIVEEAACLAETRITQADDNVVPLHRDSEPLVAEDSGYSVEDSELREIFQAEAKEHLEVIDAYISTNERQPAPYALNDELVRSLHTLAGSARMTGLDPIAEVAKALERKMVALVENGSQADASYFGLLSEGADEIRSMVSAIAMPDAPSLHSANTLVGRIEAYTPLAEGAGTVSEEPVPIEQIKLDEGVLESSSEDINGFFTPDLEEESISLEEIETLPEGEWLSEEQPEALSLGTEDVGLELPGHEEGEAISPEGIHIQLDEDSIEQEDTLHSGLSDEDALELPDVEQISSFAEDDEFPDSEIGEAVEETYETVETDPEFAEIFLEEARELHEHLVTGLTAWRADPLDTEAGENLRRTLHTLKGAARLSGVHSVGNLSHGLENLFKKVTRTGEVAEDERQLAMDVVDTLARQLDDLEEKRPIPLGTALLSELGVYGPIGLPMPEPVSVEDESALETEFVSSADEIEPELALEGGAEEDEISAPVIFDLPEDEEAQDSEPEPAFIEPSSVTEEVVDTVPPLEVLPQAAEFEAIPADAELVGIFLEEAEELIDQLDAGLRDWDAEPAETEIPTRLKRTLHTLKGGARLAGISTIGDLSHALESLLEGIPPDAIRHHASLLPLAQRASDRIADQVDSVRNGGPIRRAGELIDELEYVHQELIGAALEPAEIDESAEQTIANAEPVAEKVVTQPSAPQEQVRVRSDVLNRLVNNAGEISIYRARLEEQNTALGFNLNELEQTVARLHDQLRQMDIETEAQILYRYEREKDDDTLLEKEFDPLELDRFSTIQQLSRSLMETVNDLGSIKNLLGEQQKESETLLLQHSRISNDLQDGLLRTRMVPFTQLVPRLHRVVRQTASSLNKRAVLEVIGAEGEMDRSILERMQAPLEHILRNAVSHGIEMPEKRRTSGKDETGKISVYLAREGNDVVITVSDDGAGLNLAAIRKRAEEIGLLEAGAQVVDDDIMQLVLEPGFSTVKEVTQISGRGVGTDVVVSEVKQLGGSLEIESQPGRGTSFAIRLPFTLAISEALLVQLGDEMFAVPHPTIEGVVRINAAELAKCYDGRQAGFHYAGHDYHVRYLGHLLGTSQMSPQEGRKWLPLLLVRSGEHRVAIQIDHILGNRQIVVKSVGSQLSTVRWISGGTILADGSVALILDVSALVRMDVVHTPHSIEQTIPKKEEKPVNVMVVDDSITVRKVTTRLLKRHNMVVSTAKDGVDAVAQLQDQHPDVMLLDIEMPRMDGYELARHMRNSSELSDIPIIMITSRSGEKHRNIALSLGVKRYLGKPYQEGELLDNIYAVLAESEVEA